MQKVSFYAQLDDTRKEVFEEATESVILTRDYLKFQVQFRFFFRDTLEVIRLCPSIKTSYQKLLRKIINFNKKIIELILLPFSFKE